MDNGMLMIVADELRSAASLAQVVVRRLQDCTNNNELDLALLFKQAGIEIPLDDLLNVTNILTNVSKKLESHAAGQLNNPENWDLLRLANFAVDCVDDDSLLEKVRDFVAPILRFIPFGETYKIAVGALKECVDDEWNNTSSIVADCGISSFISSRLNKEKVGLLDFSEFDQLYEECLRFADMDEKPVSNFTYESLQNETNYTWLVHVLSVYLGMVMVIYMREN